MMLYRFVILSQRWNEVLHTSYHTGEVFVIRWEQVILHKERTCTQSFSSLFCVSRRDFQLGKPARITGAFMWTLLRIVTSDYFRSDVFVYVLLKSE